MEPVGIHERLCDRQFIAERTGGADLGIQTRVVTIQSGDPVKNCGDLDDSAWQLVGKITGNKKIE